jgi:hypothetical protein
MKMLGYLFVLAILLAVVGYTRGWFTVEAASSSERADVRMTVDRDRMSADARSVLDTVGAGGAKTAANPESLPGSSGTFLEGRITSVQTATRDLTVEAESRTSTHRIAIGTPITRDGATVAFDQLQPDMRARLSFDASKPLPILVAITILP